MPTTTHNNEQETILLEGIQRRDAGWRDQLAALLQRHQPALLARCHYYLKNREDAEEASQETLLRAFRAIHNFRGESAFRTWLFSIAERQCHDLRARRKRHLLDEHLRALIEIHEHSARQVTDESDLGGMVRSAMTRLSERNRDVLYLRFYTDLSLAEIADNLGLGLSATKMRLYRALEQLGANLPEQDSLYA